MNSLNKIASELNGVSGRIDGIGRAQTAWFSALGIFAAAVGFALYATWRGLSDQVDALADRMDDGFDQIEQRLGATTDSQIELANRLQELVGEITSAERADRQEPDGEE